MDMKQILDEELKRRGEDDILAGSRFAPSNYLLPGDLATSADQSMYGKMPAANQMIPGYGMKNSRTGAQLPPYLGLPVQPSPGRMVPQGMGQAYGMPMEQINVSYIAPDGSHVQISSSYSPAGRADAVGMVMKAAYGMIMSGSYKGGSGKSGKN